MRIEIVAAMMSLTVLVGCSSPEAEAPTPRANDTVLTLGETPVRDLSLPSRIVPCFTLHYGLLANDQEGVASDLETMCAETSTELSSEPCGDYAAAASALGRIAQTHPAGSPERNDAESVADSALKVCAS